MSKIRINELARQLEVKSREVIDKLHELGIAEKVTHSSSIDEDKADQLRRYYSGESHAPLPSALHRNGAGTAVQEPEPEQATAKEATRPAERRPRLTQQPPPDGHQAEGSAEAAAPSPVAEHKAEPAAPDAPSAPAPAAEAEKSEDDNKPRAIPHPNYRA